MAAPTVGRWQRTRCGCSAAGPPRPQAGGRPPSRTGHPPGRRLAGRRRRSGHPGRATGAVAVAHRRPTDRSARLAGRRPRRSPARPVAAGDDAAGVAPVRAADARVAADRGGRGRSLLLDQLPPPRAAPAQPRLDGARSRLAGRPGRPPSWPRPPGWPPPSPPTTCPGTRPTPPRRGRVLAGYLRDPGADPGRLGWDGTGRQRAEFALPGRVVVDGEGRLLVDVRVRVTPYRRVGTPAAEPDPEPAGTPAVAPAPTAAAGAACASRWVRLTVPIVRDGPRLAVDRWDDRRGRAGPDPGTDGSGDRCRRHRRPASPGAALVALVLYHRGWSGGRHAGRRGRGRGAARQAGSSPPDTDRGPGRPTRTPIPFPSLTRRSHHEATCMRLA